MGIMVHLFSLLLLLTVILNRYSTSQTDVDTGNTDLEATTASSSGRPTPPVRRRRKQQTEPLCSQPGDHMLLSYTLTFLNDTLIEQSDPFGQLYHAILIDNSSSSSSSSDDSSIQLPVNKALHGLCVNSSTTISISDTHVSVKPLHFGHDITKIEEIINIKITLHHLITPIEYDIFTALKTKNDSKVIDLIEDGIGINSIDEYGQSPLMIAVTKNNFVAIASLLNCHPIADVNYMKPSGYTVIYYAIQYSSVGILRTLLRRKANPNVSLLLPGSRGNTPLHHAVLLEKYEHAQLLLEHKADMYSTNEYNQTPLDMLPLGTFTTVRNKFKQLFAQYEVKRKSEL